MTKKFSPHVRVAFPVFFAYLTCTSVMSHSCKSVGHSAVSSSSHSDIPIVYGNNYDRRAIQQFVPSSKIESYPLIDDAHNQSKSEIDDINGKTYGHIINLVRENANQLVADWHIEQQPNSSQHPQLDFYPSSSREHLSQSGKLVFGDVHNTVRLMQTYYFTNPDNTKTYIPIEGGGILVHLNRDGSIAGFNSFLVPPPIEISTKEKVNSPGFKNYQKISKLSLTFATMNPNKIDLNVLKSRILQAMPTAISPALSNHIQNYSNENILPAPVRKIFELTNLDIADETVKDQNSAKLAYSGNEEQRAKYFFTEFSKAEHSLTYIADVAGAYRLAWKVVQPFGLPVIVYVAESSELNKSFVVRAIPAHQDAVWPVQIYNGPMDMPRGRTGPKILSNAQTPLQADRIAKIEAKFKIIYDAWKKNPKVLVAPDDAESAYEIGWLTMQKLLDFYATNFKWIATGGLLGTTDATVNATDLFGNAYYSDLDSLLVLGSADPSKNQNSFVYDLGVLAHEYTHAVIRKTANLEYRGQSGALNEHIADVMGIGFKAIAAGTKIDFKIGDIVLATANGGGQFRNLLDKSQNLNPESYPETITSSHAVASIVDCIPTMFNDQCGVHSLSSLPNKVAALSISAFQTVHEQSLSESDKSQPIHIHYGWLKFAKIMWTTLATRLNPKSDFLEYRNGMLNVCSEMAMIAEQSGVTQEDCGVITEQFDGVGINEKTIFGPLSKGQFRYRWLVLGFQGEETTIYGKPDKTSAPIASLPAGFEVNDTTQFDDDWSKVTFLLNGVRFGGTGSEAFIRNGSVKSTYGDGTETPPPSVKLRQCVVQSETSQHIYAYDSVERGKKALNVLPNGTKFIAKSISNYGSWFMAEYVLDGIQYGIAPQPLHYVQIHDWHAKCDPPL